MPSATYNAGDTIKVHFALRGLARRVKVARVGFYANDAAGAAVDWPATTDVWIEPATGYIYEQSRTLPAGTYTARAAAQKLDGSWKQSPAIWTLTVVNPLVAAITNLYVTILGRQPFPGEVDTYIASGKSLDTIAAEMHAFVTLVGSKFHLKREATRLTYDAFWVDTWADRHVSTTPVGYVNPWGVNGWNDPDGYWHESIDFDYPKSLMAGSLQAGLPSGLRRQPANMPAADWDGHASQLLLDNSGGDNSWGA